MSFRMKLYRLHALHHDSNPPAYECEAFDAPSEGAESDGAVALRLQQELKQSRRKVWQVFTSDITRTEGRRTSRERRGILRSRGKPRRCRRGGGPPLPQLLVCRKAGRERELKMLGYVLLIFSGVLPYSKLILMLVGWIIPTRLLGSRVGAAILTKPKIRERLASPAWWPPARVGRRISVLYAVYLPSSSHHRQVV